VYKRLIQNFRLKYRTTVHNSNKSLTPVIKRPLFLKQKMGKKESFAWENTVYPDGPSWEN